MRIAQITPKYYPHIGGVEKVVQRISEEMAAKGHEVEVFTTDGPAEVSREHLNGVTVSRFPKSLAFHYSRKLKEHLIKHGHQYSIIHAHNFHTLVPLLSAAARQKAAKKFPLVLQGHYHGKGKTAYTSFLLKCGRPTFRQIYSQANLFLCLTEFEKKLLKNHFKIPEKSIGIVPNGVNIEDIEAAETCQERNKDICIVSRLEKYKNVHLALKAIKCLPKEYHLTVIGDGPYKQTLIRLAEELNITERVSFLNFIPLQELYRRLKASRLVLNLSNLESFGLTVIEGLAAGRPVLVNNRTALAELAERFEGVAAVDAVRLSPLELAAAIREKAEKPLQTKPDLEAYKWGAIADRLLAYYEAALGSKR